MAREIVAVKVPGAARLVSNFLVDCPEATDFIAKVEGADRETLMQLFSSLHCLVQDTPSMLKLVECVMNSKGIHLHDVHNIG